jgi:predicted nucleic acid-binding protein
MQLAEDRSAAAAWSVLDAIHAMPDHVFWNDGFSYREVAFAGVTGSRQVTDAWLAELARRHSAQLATLDFALAALHSDVGFLIPQ